MSTIKLTGITWDHTRGFTSAVATAQRFHELNPEIDIEWKKRSLQAFADEPISELANRFDLLIIDHPWTGFAARTGVIIPLDDYINAEFLEDQRSNSVGASHESYSFNGKQWALAIDAATPVAASRADLFQNKQLELPKNWKDLVMLAEKGFVAIPGIPQDTLMSFYMICSTLGEDVCREEDFVISEEIGLQALEMLRELGEHIASECYDMNPIKVYEAMTKTDKFLYSPFAYGYSNYAKSGYAGKQLEFHDMIEINGQKLITTLGGTGLAISANSNNIEAAVKYAKYFASAEIQKTIFYDFGGQPGHRSAWVDDNVNQDSNNYFRNTLPALDRAFLRPRYHGHMYFQDRTGAPIREFMMNGGNPRSVLDNLNSLYRESLKLQIG